MGVAAGRDACRRPLRAIAGEKVLVRYFPGPRTGDFLRITVGSDEQMDALLAAI